jgi:uncharacterized cupredoxin-like copper-binding protein
MTRPARIRRTVIAGFCLVLVPLLISGVHAEVPTTVRLEMREFAFAPAILRVPAGRPVRLLLVNRGQLAHQLDAPALRRLPATVVGGTLHVETLGLEIVRVQPGGSAIIQILPPRRGRFPFACTIEGHKEAGMTGVFDVR